MIANTCGAWLYFLYYLHSFYRAADWDSWTLLLIIAPMIACFTTFYFVGAWIHDHASGSVLTAFLSAISHANEDHLLGNMAGWLTAATALSFQRRQRAATGLVLTPVLVTLVLCYYEWFQHRVKLERYRNSWREGVWQFFPSAPFVYFYELGLRLKGRSLGFSAIVYGFSGYVYIHALAVASLDSAFLLPLFVEVWRGLGMFGTPANLQNSASPSVKPPPPGESVHGCVL